MSTHDSAPAAPSRRVAVGDREEAVIARLRTLSTALDGEPDPQFRAATRARLVAMAAVRQPAPAPKRWIRRVVERAEDRAPSPWRGRLTAGLTGAAVAVTAFAALIAVSTGSQPGSALYALKRGTEQTQLALTSDSNRGTTLLGFARTRLHELQDMTKSGSSAAPAVGTAPGGAGTVLAAGPSTSLVLDTIATMNRQTTEGTYWVTTEALRAHDPAALDDLSAWAQAQSSGLQALTPQLPQAAQSAAGQALALVNGVQTRGSALGTALTCPSGAATTAADQLGPVPAACPLTPPVRQGPGTLSQPPGVTVRPSPGPTGNVPTPLSTGGALPGTGGSGGSGTPGAGVTRPSLPTVPGSPETSGGGVLPLPSLPIPGLLPGSSATSPSGTPTTPSLPICIPALGITC